MSLDLAQGESALPDQVKAAETLLGRIRQT
jgi:hypothetical protein